MKNILFFLSFFLVSAIVFPRPAHAIIFLPALILIPIAKIVAVIITGLSLPALGIGAVWKKLYGGSTKKILRTLIIILLLSGLLIIIFLKILNPDRPLF